VHANVSIKKPQCQRHFPTTTTHDCWCVEFKLRMQILKKIGSVQREPQLLFLNTGKLAHNLEIESIRASG
jgi:hypothetical protein